MLDVLLYLMGALFGTLCIGTAILLVAYWLSASSTSTRWSRRPGRLTESRADRRLKEVDRWAIAPSKNPARGTVNRPGLALRSDGGDRPPPGALLAEADPVASVLVDKPRANPVSMAGQPSD
jgi:hypothetical protein